jgi:hypothetical protein
VEVNNNKESDKRQGRRRNLNTRKSLTTGIRRMRKHMRKMTKKCEDDENNKEKARVE